MYPVAARSPHLAIGHQPNASTTSLPQKSQNYDDDKTSIHEIIKLPKPFDAIKNFLVKKPHCVNDRGFNNQTALHKLSLTGNSSLVSLLLDFGADINAVDNFDSTPLHFACKQGNPAVLHCLVQRGANINSVDKKGMGGAHHAAQGGSVYVMHYLLDVCGIDVNSRDLSLCTPLHIAVRHGQMELIDYFAAKKHCDVLARNSDGDSALHLAVRRGHRLSSSKLLEKCPPLLDLVNNDGMTALDLAQASDDQSCRDVIEVLRYHSISMVAMVTPAAILWYWNLLKPTTFCLAIFITAQLLSSPTNCICILVGLMILLGLVFRQSHRLNSISRLPNPVYIGGFLSGAFYTTTYYYAKIVPFVFDEFRLLTYLSVPLFCLMTWAFWLLMTRNPGVCTDSLRRLSGKQYSIRDVASGELEVSRFCPKCEIIKPLRGKHCNLCNRCYSDLDHHCLFLYRCVARDNHRLFLLFIFLTVLFITSFLFLSLSTLPALPIFSLEAVSWLLNHDPWLCALLVANGLSWFWGVHLLYIQLSVISLGHTTAWCSGRAVRLTLVQRLRNVVAFFRRGVVPQAPEFQGVF